MLETELDKWVVDTSIFQEYVRGVLLPGYSACRLFVLRSIMVMCFWNQVLTFWGEMQGSRWRQAAGRWSLDIEFPIGGERRTSVRRSRAAGTVLGNLTDSNPQSDDADSDDHEWWSSWSWWRWRWSWWWLGRWHWLCNITPTNNTSNSRLGDQEHGAGWNSSEMNNQNANISGCLERCTQVHPT